MRGNPREIVERLENAASGLYVDGGVTITGLEAGLVTG
jgi:hypothetical protein